MSGIQLFPSFFILLPKMEEIKILLLLISENTFIILFREKVHIYITKVFQSFDSSKKKGLKLICLTFSAKRKIEIL